MRQGGATEELIGRQRELEVIEAALAELDQGRCVWLGFIGEPGIGKTRLLRELCHRAGEGSLLLAGRGTEFEREVPFAVAIDALDRHLGTLPAAVLEDLGGERLSELVAVFPSLAGIEAEPSGRLHVERFRLHDAVRALLERLAARGPVLLVLDDVHWADEASVELLNHLLRRRPDAALLIALAYRPGQASRRLQTALARGELIEIRPRRLTEEQAGRLLGTDLQPATRRALYRETGGNPFYLEELARALRSRPREPGTDELRLGVTPGVRATLDEELLSLTRDARVLLQAAAVTGEPFEPGLARAVADLSEGQSRDAIGELLARELVHPARDPPKLAFRHPILRRAVYESAGEGWRIEAHGRAAAVLAGRKDALATRAHHLELSAAPGDEEALAVLHEASRASERAPAAAARWLEAALRLLPANERDRRLRLLVSLATARGAIGSIRESQAALSEALELVPAQRAATSPDAAILRGQILGAIAGLDHMQARRGDARALLEQALRDLDDERSALAGVLRIELAVHHWFAGELEATAANARQALHAAEGLGNRVMRAETLVLLALGEYSRGATAEGVRWMDEAERAVDSLSESDLSRRVRVLLCLGHASSVLERVDTGASALERGLKIARATGQSQWFVPLQVYMSIMRILQGRLGEAEEAAASAFEAASLLDNPHSLMLGWTMRSWLARLKGDLSGAVHAAERALELVSGLRSAFQWLPGCHLGAALMEAGQTERGRRELLAGAGGPELSSIEPTFRAQWYEILAHGELAGGRVDEAERWVARSEAAAERFAAEARTARALRGRAAVLL
ncbi:MAG: ATP-binding protein, partial [Thermoleophilaceae bacterium]